MGLLQSIPVSMQTLGLLLASNVFMTFGWYGHLRNLATALSVFVPFAVLYMSEPLAWTTCGPHCA